MQQYSEQEMDVFPQGGILPIHSKKNLQKTSKKLWKPQEQWNDVETSQKWLGI